MAVLKDKVALKVLADQSSKRPEATSFEDMMSKFKQTSDEKMSDLKRFNEGSSRRSGRGSRGNSNNGYSSR